MPEETRRQQAACSEEIQSVRECVRDVKMNELAEQQGEVENEGVILG